ncbi:unnamed protein product [Camellia sinensis]
MNTALTGYIVLRGWCENPNTFSNGRKFHLNPKESWSTHKTILKQYVNHTKRSCKKDNKVILWFEVDDTGCESIQANESLFLKALSKLIPQQLARMVALALAYALCEPW